MAGHIRPTADVTRQSRVRRSYIRIGQSSIQTSARKPTQFNTARETKPQSATHTHTDKIMKCGRRISAAGNFSAIGRTDRGCKFIVIRLLGRPQTLIPCIMPLSAAAAAFIVRRSSRGFGTRATGEQTELISRRPRGRTTAVRHFSMRFIARDRFAAMMPGFYLFENFDELCRCCDAGRIFNS